MIHLKGVFRFLDTIIDKVYHLTIVTIIFIVLLVCLNIFSRYVLNYPLNWIPGFVTLLSNWAVFLMVGVYMYRRQEIVIPYFYERFFPPRMKKTADIIVILLIIMFTLTAGWNSFKNLQTADYLTSLITIPIHYYWYTMPFFIGMFIGLLGGFKQLLRVDGCSD